MLVFALAAAGCYTQLGASEGYRLPQSASATPPAADVTYGDPQAPGARVGLNGMAQEEYVAEYGAYEYGEEGYADDAVYYEDVEVTRYQPDRAYYDSYHGSRSTYVSHHYYYPHWQPYYHRPAWRGHGYYDPFYRSGFSFSVGFSWGTPGYYGAYYDPFYSPRYYDPFYAFYDPFYYGPSYGYHLAFGSPYRYGRSTYGLGYRHGYRDGFHDGGYYGWPYYGGRHYTPGVAYATRRGSVRSALNPDWNRERRSALAAMTDTRRVTVDAPVGTRSIRTLADDTRQHVLVNRATRAGIESDRGLAGRGTRLTDDAARTPRATRPATDVAPGVTPRTAPRVGRDLPTRPETRTAPERAPRTEPVSPERSRWDRPETTTRPAPRETTRPAPAPRQQTEPRPAPPPRETTRPAPTRQAPQTRPAPRETTRPAPAPRQRTEPRPAPPPRETPPPRRETREEEPPRRESRSVPATRAQETARPAPARSQQGTARPAPRPAPQRTQASPPPRPAPQRTQSSPSPRPSNQGATPRTTTRSSNDSGRTSRSGRGNDE